MKNNSPREILGIVGSSKIDYEVGHRFITKLIHNLPENTVIVTGDAKGVDFIVRNVCLKLNRSHSIIYSKEKNFVNGYKKRNKVIAGYCDRIISIALPPTNTTCYHCNRKDHERTGGCFTGKINGNYEVMVVK